MTELIEPPFTRYYLRQPHGSQELINTYISTHEAIKQLPYILSLKPSELNKRWPQRTSDHYIMFVSIMEKYQEDFEKELFKLSLQYHSIEIAKKDTIQHLRQKDDVDW